MNIISRIKQAYEDKKAEYREEKRIYRDEYKKARFNEVRKRAKIKAKAAAKSGGFVGVIKRYKQGYKIRQSKNKWL